MHSCSIVRPQVPRNPNSVGEPQVPRLEGCSTPGSTPRYAEHKLMILGQLRPGEFKGGYATTYGGCLVAPIGVLCLVVYRVDLLRRSVCSASVADAVECWFGSRFGEARIG